MLAVSFVVLNRARATGKPICEVVYARKQFSWTAFSFQKRMESRLPGAMREASQSVAFDVLRGADDGGHPVKNFLGEQTKFYAHKAIKNKWTSKMKVVLVLKNHIFYRS